MQARVAGRVYHEIQPVVGDRAVASFLEELPLIETILPRRSVLQRTAPLGRSTQIIAANVDTVLVISSLHSPDFSHGFTCRALAAASWRKLGALLVVNKTDLCRSEDDELLLKEISEVYGPNGAGYVVHEVSCRTGEGTGELLNSITGSTVVMSGPSGAGKTSLAKEYVPSLEVRIGAVNPKTEKGRHTTVAARLIPLDGETALIDTPGLRMFSIEHIPTEELQFCFPEFARYIGQCRFRDCLHMTEPGCAVKRAAGLGEVPAVRYDVYRGFMEDAVDRA